MSDTQAPAAPTTTELVQLLDEILCHIDSEVVEQPVWCAHEPTGDPQFVHPKFGEFDLAPLCSVDLLERIYETRDALERSTAAEKENH